MKPVSVYRPTSVEEAIQILSLHGTESGVYAGGTDLLIQLKNRIPAAPNYLVDIKKIVEVQRDDDRHGQGAAGLRPRTPNGIGLT